MGALGCHLAGLLCKELWLSTTGRPDTVGGPGHSTHISSRYFCSCPFYRWDNKEIGRSHKVEETAFTYGVSVTSMFEFLPLSPGNFGWNILINSVGTHLVSGSKELLGAGALDFGVHTLLSMLSALRASSGERIILQSAGKSAVSSGKCLVIHSIYMWRAQNILLWKYRDNNYLGSIFSEIFTWENRKHV